MLKTFKYRLYPDLNCQKIIDSWINDCRETYNHFLSERKEKWEHQKIIITKFDQFKSLVIFKKEKTHLQNIYAEVLRDPISRLDNSFRDFFRRIKKKEKCGYPIFKGKKYYNSFSYQQSGFWIRNNKLELSKIGKIKIKLNQKIEGKIKTCTIIKKNDKYYACFSVEVEPKILSKTNKEIGIDLGITHLLQRVMEN